MFHFDSVNSSYYLGIMAIIGHIIPTHIDISMYTHIVDIMFYTTTDGPLLTEIFCEISVQKPSC